jgi:hypothetical protein
LLRLLVLAVALVFLVGACGGDDDSEPSDIPDGEATQPTESTDDGEETGGDDSGDDEGDPGTVRAPLEAGSSAEVEAPDVGRVRMTIVEILDEADQILGPGLTVDPGFKLWAIDGLVEVAEDATGEAIAAFTVETSSGQTYDFTGTGSGNDLGFAFQPGATDTGYLAFLIPEDEEVVRLRAEFDIYVGYDIIFED